MRKIVLISTSVLVALATIASMASAEATTGPWIDLSGQGRYEVAADGSAAVSGWASGSPFRGPYTSVLAADDGSLPEPGVCEPGTATYAMTGKYGKHLDLVATGDVCGQHVQPPFVVTHVFTGRYEVVKSNRAARVGTDGFLEVRLATEDRASVTAIDT